MAVYGKAFAEVYNKHWAFFGPRMWPFLSGMVARRVPGARSWLDLCCGAGSLLKLVCEAGFDAVGLDLSPHQLRYARLNAPRARLVQADVRDLELEQEFDVITCMFDSLNYLLTRRDLERAFRRVRRHMAPAGVFIFDVNTFEGLQDAWCRTSTIRDARCTIIIASSFDQRRARGRCLITGFVREGRLYGKFEEEHIQRGYRASEVDGLLEKAGFALRKYDGRTFCRPRKRSGRLLYVCRRRAP